MAKRHFGQLGVSILAVLIAGGCVEQSQSRRLNSAWADDCEKEVVVREYMAYHNDQGMLADMSIADIHFVPHTSYLSGTGEARLERYAELLARTGGRVNYDTRLRDKDLVAARVGVAKTFLAEALPSNKTIDVVLGLPGGRGMDAREAIAAEGVAKQPEPRENAYDLTGRSGSGG